MHEIDGDSFSRLLEYIYTNEIDINEDNFLQLLLCADRFLASDMKLRIEQLLEEAMQNENVVDLLLLSERAATPRLRKACINCTRVFLLLFFLSFFFFFCCFGPQPVLPVFFFLCRHHESLLRSEIVFGPVAIISNNPS